MGDLLGSVPGCARVRPKCAGKTCVGLWGQSTVSMSSHQRSERPGCYTAALGKNCLLWELFSKVYYYLTFYIFLLICLKFSINYNLKVKITLLNYKSSFIYNDQL